MCIKGVLYGSQYSIPTHGDMAVWGNYGVFTISVSFPTMCKASLHTYCENAVIYFLESPSLLSLALFGYVHRRIGGAQKRILRCFVIRINGVTEACRSTEGKFLNLKRLIEYLFKPVNNLARAVLGLHGWNQYGKLISARRASMSSVRS